MDPKVIADDFLNIIQNHYFDMEGRVRRQDFWTFVLACFVVGVVAAIIASFLPFGGVLSALVSFALLLPMAGMGARRLQDTGRKGTMVWALIVPVAIMNLFSLLAALSGPYGTLGFLYFIYSFSGIVNLIAFIATLAMIYFWVQDGTPGPNQYGADPKNRPAAA